MKEFLEGILEDPQVVEAVLARHRQVVRGLTAESALKQAVAAAGGRNLTAIRACLDESAIAESEDMDTAAAAQVAELKKQSPYLFGALQAAAPGTGTALGLGAVTMEQLGKMSPAEYRRYRKGN